jgi:hypothetical protein
VGENRWEPLVEKGRSFFTHGATFDPKRRQVIGVKSGSGGIWLLDIDTAEWRRVAVGAGSGWHNSAAFDVVNDTVVSFGSYKRSDDVWQYRMGEDQGVVMPTPGPRPPGAEALPLVYHPRLGKTVALVETGRKGDAGETQTWLYSTNSDSWEQLGSTTLPFRIGINYNMVYDPNHDLLVLVANYPKEPTTVWVLRL